MALMRLLPSFGVHFFLARNPMHGRFFWVGIDPFGIGIYGGSTSKDLTSFFDFARIAGWEVRCR